MFPAFFLAITAAAWMVDAADSNELYNTFGSVVYVRSGERTPVMHSDKPVLTALGANQMFELGQHFRGRYISESGSEAGLGTQIIQGVQPDLLNNDQIHVQTLDRAYLVSSAQAFMQGLYPPFTINSTRNGQFADATGRLANGSAIDAPLGGYQYANIQAVGEMDPQSIYIAGHQNCPTSQLASAMYEVTDNFEDMQSSEKSTYESLDLEWFDGDLETLMLDYRYAYEVADSLSYAYTHNADALAKLNNDSSYTGVYDRIRRNADQDAWYRYGNTSSASDDSDNQAMGGKTLAAIILGAFQKIVQSGGNVTDGTAPPLSLFFGDHEPMVSFLSIAMVDYLAQSVQAVPAFGSALIFELFTMKKDNAFPEDHNDLWIRFFFHNATESFDGSPAAFSLFGNGPSHMDVQWSEFEDIMVRLMVSDLSSWCTTCSSPSLFCSGADGSSLNLVLDTHSSKLSPTIAGVIGAVVSLAVAGLLFAIAMLLGGIRFHRATSSLRGFKGSAKLASDADVTLSGNAAPPAGILGFGAAKDKSRVQHERVGSWELRQKEMGGETGDVGDESRRASMDAIEAAMSRPVEPTERV